VKGEFKITSGELARIIGGEIVAGKDDILIETITTDSRELGDKNLFVPIIGEKFDGHSFIEELFATNKILCALTMKDGYEAAAVNNNKVLIKCSDTLEALGKIAKFHRDKFNPVVVGITGTNGKTTTKELVACALSSKFNTLKNIKNYNNEIGVPFTLLQLNSSHEAAVVEMGMNHPGEIERLSNMVSPDLAVITSIGAGHLEFLGTVENVAYAKSEIICGMKKGSTLAINRDTECFHIAEEQALKNGINLVTFGLSDDSILKPDHVKLTVDSINMKYKGIDFSVPLYGKHNVYNLMAAIAVSEILSLDLHLVRDSLCQFENVGGRSEIIDKGFIVINDTYNSNPLSSLFALESLCEVFPDRKKFAVLADMKELGELAPLYHIKVGEFVANRNFKELLLFGEMSDYYEKGALSAGMKPDRILKFDDKLMISDYLLPKLCDRDVVLVKGSRSMKMEDVVLRLIS